MVGGQIDELSRLLGAIEAKVDLVTKTQSEDRLSAAAWRTTILGDLDELKEDRAERRGISRVGHLLAAMFGGSAALGLQWLMKKFGNGG